MIVFNTNSLIQAGSKVKFKTGCRLNGSIGTAVQIMPDDIVLVVVRIGCVEMGVGVPIQGLEWHGDRKTELKETWLMDIRNDNNDIVYGGGDVVAGKIGDELFLGIVVHKTKKIEELHDHINAQFLKMGVPESMWFGGKDPFNQSADLPKAWISETKRSGNNFFMSLGGGPQNTKGNIWELGIKPPTKGSCVACGCDAEKRCSSCVTMYCSSTCQKQHWKSAHKTECKVIRAAKVKAAWRRYDDELLRVERPDGEAKLMCRKRDDGSIAEWEPVRESRIFFNSENGPVDTGLIVRYRITMKDGVQGFVTVVERCFNQNDIVKYREDMIGTMFYEQPCYDSEIFKLKKKGDLLGDKEPISCEEALDELKFIAGRECDFKLSVKQGLTRGKHFIEDGFFVFADVACNDFFLESYFEAIHILKA